ncbi:isopenicillin N synthase family oxygenase [Pseudonocardia sp. KRD-184]|uniref:Isopenicillin N synthase family oxygenase n=1 Tax=Pseudonocardia oceani TaxID=2792013 RepID=A0ABS6UF45_9PSEU|nr:2-oxoglutarate and iron-dependent oxygenase domain-containing protein [Pseudonocardia oceani]MBW0089174.1 isopenicillin N synthase family oxygenase [Pseudonocardia oceani]MBW0096119.1 isopenicillin N synthase family oxygenase [Pseudonocardia oceani]MBW0111258.1 isopenicillin N synthase family oxygenase [Pseudonocardia oceani]MBW0120963.1 isopenicillin N synthase family oxygenase [Pseudonocardia oceani]MBW0130870.1 isopenicillin N synthase family oxygenase [Pseudonocardia oceani]
MTTTSLPVLDMALLDRGGAGAAEFRAALRTATHEVGFFYLVGHGIGDDVTARAFAEAERFFALPDEDKRRVEMLRSPQFRGYTRTGGELTQGRVDWREQIDIGAERAACDDPSAPEYMRLEGPNLWPEAQPGLREVFTDWERRCTAVARRLVQSWAVALGGEPELFDSAFGDRPSTLIKLVRYPGREDRGQGVGAHKDPGVMTLLLVEPGKGGLQIGTADGWIEAPALPGAFVVNIGELLEFATDGYLRATVHRVVSPPPGETRLSIPFFFNPALDSSVPRVALPPELAAQAAGVTRDPDNVISGTFGENLLKARLRAHPDVAAAHHADLLAARAGS